MQTLNNGKVTLVGAGPGDPDLFTIKGLKALQKAEVILYDALINPKLLDHNRTAKKIFVGKRRGFTKKTQVEINELIVEYALKGFNVVRLKGGDPLVFGRFLDVLVKNLKSLGHLKFKRRLFLEFLLTRASLRNIKSL